MRYTLTGSTATLALTVANTGDKALPFSVGFHPYFAASKLDNVAFDIDAATCSESAKGEQPAAPETITLTRKEECRLHPPDDRRKEPDALHRLRQRPQGHGRL
ncbi:hypothetical protein NIA69_08810 [Gemmiger formicilis]|nr:hypothetical protein [Gemmiger formicilis]